MAFQCFVGETLTLTAQDLLDTRTGLPVTSGATVTHAVYDKAGTLVDSVAGTANGDDWSGSLDAPAVAGKYTVKTTAVYNGATAKRRTELEVEDF